MKKLVFVYGSLKQGFWNNDVLGDSKLLTPAFTKAKYWLTNCGFPYLIPEDALGGPVSHPTAAVAGEVYEVTCEDVMASLDALEGVPMHYQHHNTVVVDGWGNEYEVVAYIPAEPEMAVQYPICDKYEVGKEWVYEWA